MTELTLVDRFRGLVVGAAVGDCLGRPVEGLRLVPDSYLDELDRHPHTLLYSDDTIMMMGLVESLLERDGFDGAHMADKFVTAWRAQPERGYGSNVVLAFGMVHRGLAWDEAARRQFGGQGSYGNGGAMRVAPVALWSYPDAERTIALARETAAVTHTHPAGVEGAVIQAMAAHHALRGDDFDRSSLLADLDRLIETGVFRSKLAILHDALERADDDWARLQLGNWVAASNSVLTALYCFLLSRGFEDAMRRAMRLAGDTDTIGAMAGALAGARYGMGQIPERWHRRSEGVDHLIGLADRLHQRVVAD